MTDSPNLALPYIEDTEGDPIWTHNDDLDRLDALAQLAVLDRDLASPPGSPTNGARWIVAAAPTGDWAGQAGKIAAWQDDDWEFFTPKIGWLCYVVDEGALVAWNGSAWVDAMAILATLQNMVLLGVGTTADATNPFSAKLNNALWTAKSVAEGGDGNLRYKLNKESAAKTLSLLFQDNYSGRAEIGLTGDDDFHLKVSADGSTWVDALLIDKATGAAKVNGGLFLTGDISPSQITADQNDYNPSGLAAASILRLSSDAARNVNGLSGGGDGRVVTILNVGANAIALKDASSSSIAGNRFSFGADITLAPKQSAVLWYDATDSRWKLVAGPVASSSGTSPKFMAYKSAGAGGQSIANSTFTKVTLDAETFDTNSNYDTSNSRFTPTVAGKYIVGFTPMWTSLPDGAVFVLAIYKNGAEMFRLQNASSSSASAIILSLSGLIDMNGSTDYLEFYVYQTSGATQTIAAGSNQTYAWGTLLP